MCGEEGECAEFGGVRDIDWDSVLAAQLGDVLVGCGYEYCVDVCDFWSAELEVALLEWSLEPFDAAVYLRLESVGEVIWGDKNGNCADFERFETARGGKGIAANYEVDMVGAVDGREEGGHLDGFEDILVVVGSREGDRNRHLLCSKCLDQGNTKEI